MGTFPATRISVIARLRSDDAAERTRAFDLLVAIYWKPVYKYLRVARGWASEDAEDLTQGFFVRALENESLAGYDVEKASFRTFLRLLVDRFAANELKAAARQKRGGSAEHLDFQSAESELAVDPAGQAMNPEDYFQREWVRNVFAVAVERLRSAVSPTDFSIFEAYDLAEDRSISYRQLSEQFALPETTITNRLSATRRLFRQGVLETLRDVTANDDEFRAEAKALLGIDA